jgi:hypothetical protein
MPNEAGFLTDITGTPISSTNGIPISGTVTTTPPVSSTGTITSVTINNSSTTVLAANATRKGAALYVDGTLPANLYILVGAGTASATNYTVQLSSSLPYYEVPFTYQGIISHIGTSATGTIRVTEFT